ncbi:MAG: long-chain fatty acid--CoA ligase, partial [Calditrichaeota bacterium]
MEFKDYPNIYAMLTETVEKRRDTPAYRWFEEPGKLRSVTWEQFRQQVEQAARSLLALGIEHGDKINILSYTCYPWVLMDFAITSIGAVTVGIYQSNLPKDCGYIINHSDAVLIFVENEEQLQKVLEIRKEIPNIRKVVMFYGTPPEDDWVISLEEFLKLGQGISEAAFRERAAAVKPEDVAGIVYTSGTTGLPKGAMLTHDNICFTCQSVLMSTDIQPGDETILFLPLAHVFARIIVYATMLGGCTLSFARSIEAVAEDIRVVRPTWFASVPRIYEKVHTKVVGSVESKGGLALKLFNWALKVGLQVSDRKLNKQPIPAGLRWKYKLATKLVFGKIQAALGGRVRWCISGAAPLNPDIARFFHAAGILILEGIGMTENTSFSHVNRYDNYRFGWVGLPGPGIECKTAEDGEVLIRGRNVMKGYYKMPEETARAIDKEGWLHTGDVGEIDEEGFLRITGRKKELIITAGGKNIAPAPIEGLIATS